MTHNNLRNIDLNLLTALEALLEERHVSQAAEKLGLSQSAMSRALGRLRDLFGDELLVRGSPKMILTKRAVGLQKPLKEALSQVHKMLESQHFNPATTYQNFQVKGSSYVTQVYFSSVMKRFYKEAPHASISFQNFSMNDLVLQDIHSVDLSFCGIGFNIPDSYIQRHLGYDETIVVMAQHHPLAQKHRITLDEYVSYPHCTVSLGGNSSLSTMDPVLAKLGYSRKVQMSSPHIISCLEMVSKTELLFSIPSNLVKHFQKHFNLVIKPLPMDYKKVDYFLTWHPVHQNDPAHIWLRNIFYEEIKPLFRLKD